MGSRNNKSSYKSAAQYNTNTNQGQEYSLDLNKNNASSII